MTKYRCCHCKKILDRDSQKHWILSYCETSNRYVHLYEWYAGEWVCGGCGYVFVSGEGRARSGKAERKVRRKWVRETWPKCKAVHMAAVEVYAAIIGR